MGRTQKPLKILCFPPVDSWEEIGELREQGHRILLFDPLDMDLILGPRAWRMDEEHRQYLDLAIKEARKVRYPKGGKDDPAS